MKAWLTPHGNDALVVRYDNVALVDERSVLEFFSYMKKAVKDVTKGRRVYLLIDISTITISLAAAKFYGPLSKSFLDELLLGYIRFGDPQGMTKVVLLTQSIVNHTVANVYADLDAATAALERLRQNPPDR